MTEESFRSLIKKDHHQVFLFASNAGLPISFGTHPWFVCSEKGQISRWEILFRKNQCPTCWGHLHLNYLPPTVGLEIFPITFKALPYLSKYHWKGELLAQIEGKRGSTANQLIDFIQESKEKYPFRDKYSFIGPNSNTYAQWVIDHFPESNFQLPRNSFGRHYAVK